MTHSRDWPALAAEFSRALQVSRQDPRGFMGTTRDGNEVVVEHARGATVDWVVVRTPICAQTEMDPVLVLERNARLAFAVIVLGHGTYWLRVAVPFDSTELDDAAQLIALLVDAARSLWPNRVAPPPSTVLEIFSYYTS